MRTAVIQNNSLLDSGRIDPSYHLSESIKLKKQLLGSPYTLSTIGEKSEEVFLGNIFTRVFVKDAEHGIPYIAASDMTKAGVDSGKFISKKQAKKLKRLMLDSGWILISCSGTLGNLVYTNDLFKNTFATHDLIRLIPDDEKMLSGFLYAYLASKYGYTLLTQSGFGGVVKHINQEHVANIPVPIFPELKQQEIHNLIVESANLRAEANLLLEEAQNRIISMLNIDNEVEVRKVSIKNILTSHQQRFESQYYKSIGSIYRDKILQLNHILLNDASERIFRPGIFKRNYVKDGIDFLGGSDITKHIPNSEKKLSKKQTSNFDELTLKEDWILVTCGGTIGTSVLVNSYLANKLASQHILRVIPKGLKSGYLFAFLSSEIGLKIIQSFTYGSVIPQIEPHHLELVPIPLFANEIMNEIHLSVMKYKCNLNEAIIKENQAISLVEKEIESWQQS